jgi:carbamoyl-phosphate synthase small subunit
MFCYDFCELPANATTKLTLNEYLLKYKIPGLKGVNTRKIISDLREQGVVRAKLTNNIKNIKKVIDEIKN